MGAIVGVDVGSAIGIIDGVGENDAVGVGVTNGVVDGFAVEVAIGEGLQLTENTPLYAK